VGAKAMTEQKDRERVIAEITLSHLIRLGNQQGCPVSRLQVSHSSITGGERMRFGNT